MAESRCNQAEPDVEPSQVTPADKLVWCTPSGSPLTCVKNLDMDSVGKAAFTQGEKYKVESMHPIALPAYVRVTDDQGVIRQLEGGHLQEFFGR
jgi:hypothetical protein